MYDIYIRALSLPSAVEGVTVMNYDGTFSVYVNSCLCEEKQIEAANHELCHIKKDHFWKVEPVIFNELEATAEEKTVPNLVHDLGRVIVL